MPRAYIQNGIWRAQPIARCDAGSQRQATLRVSILAAVGTLALALGHGGDQPGMKAPGAVLISAPEIVVAKTDERVPAMAATGSPFRRRAPLAAPQDAASAGFPETTAAMRPAATPRQDAEAIDGGLIRVDGVAFQLAGIAQPEAGRMCRRLDGLAVACADRAHSYLQLLIKGRPVSCERAPEASGGTAEATCRVGEHDVAEQLVRQGWARAGDRPEERFLLAEASAKRQKLGMWRE